MAPRPSPPSRWQLRRIACSRSRNPDGKGAAPRFQEVGPHSLRFGGASALWAAYQDTTLVQRWGRWRSQAFQGYLWEAKDNAKGIARDMAKADLTLV